LPSFAEFRKNGLGRWRIQNGLAELNDPRILETPVWDRERGLTGGREEFILKEMWKGGSRSSSPSAGAAERSTKTFLDPSSSGRE